MAGKVAAALEYERSLVPVLFRPCAEDLVRCAPPARGARVLDLACRTGIVSRIAAPYIGDTGEIIGVDSDEAMLAVAQASFPPALRSLVSWRCASAEELPFAESSFDIVYCNQGFQFFNDMTQATRECARVLRVGGILAVSLWRGFQSLQSHLQHSGFNIRNGALDYITLAYRA